MNVFCLLLLVSYANHSYSFRLHQSVRPLSLMKLSQSRMGDYNNEEGSRENEEGMPASTIPMRYDTMKIFVSGVIGVDLKEAYLSNDHYVVNFPIAIQGHFNPVHDWEKMKAAETMWMQTEVWDQEAKKMSGVYGRGSKICGMGTMVLNKWKDKLSGEERKMFKLRILKIMDPDEFKELARVGEEEEEFGEDEAEEYEQEEEEEEDEEGWQSFPTESAPSVPPVRAVRSSSFSSPNSAAAFPSPPRTSRPPPPPPIRSSPPPPSLRPSPPAPPGRRPSGPGTVPF